MATNGATLADLLPQLLPALQFAQQAAQQNYATQQTRYNSAEPLRQSLLAMTQGLMPRSYMAQGLAGMPSGSSAQPLTLPSLPTQSPNDLINGYQTRQVGHGGSVAGGALSGGGLGFSFGGPLGAGIGAGLGALTGLFGGHHAASASSDLSVADATDAITKAIQMYQGRAPQPGEVAQLLAGQGLKPGDHWVGHAGLSGVLNSIQQQGHR